MGTKGEIAIATLLTITGIAITTIGGSYGWSSYVNAKTNDKLDKHIDKDTEIYERISKLEAKTENINNNLLLLVKSQGLTPSVVSQN